MSCEWRFLGVALLPLMLAGCQHATSPDAPLSRNSLRPVPNSARVETPPPDPAHEPVTSPEPTVPTTPPVVVAPTKPAVPVSPSVEAPRTPELETISPVGAPWPTNWVQAWVPLESWCAFNGLEPPRRVGVGPHPSYEVRTRRFTVTLRCGSRVAYCNGTECWLEKAPQLVGDVPYVHASDARKTLQPLARDGSFLIRRSATPTIVIDAGHGGRDVGTSCSLNSCWEKQHTLDWAIRLRHLLETNGWRVVLTRTNDIDLSLSNRVSIAEDVRADLFVSLHFNSGGRNRDLAGVETYCLTPVGMASHLVREFDDDTAQVFPNNAFDESNLQFALTLHQSLLRTTRAVDRGVRRARFMGVLRGQNRPAVLIEGGYLSNDRESQQIGSAAYRQKLAEGVAAALPAAEWRMAGAE